MKRLTLLMDGLDDMTNADGAKFIDRLLQYLELNNDAALSRFLQIKPPHISKMRRNHLPISPSVLLRAHDVTGLSIATLRDFARG